MDISDHFFDIELVLSDNGFVTILEQVSSGLAFLSEILRISAVKQTHKVSQRVFIDADQEMVMIVHEAPRIE
jgi:hypothetical protein